MSSSPKQAVLGADVFGQYSSRMACWYLSENEICPLVLITERFHFSTSLLSLSFLVLHFYKHSTVKLKVWATPQPNHAEKYIQHHQIDIGNHPMDVGQKIAHPLRQSPRDTPIGRRDCSTGRDAPLAFPDPNPSTSAAAQGRRSP